jgi:putative transposase
MMRLRGEVGMVADAKPMPDPARARSPPARAWSPGRPLDITEADWSEAVRREATVRALATMGVNSQSAVHAAAASLGLSTAQVYRLIARFRRHPVTLSLVVAKPGPKKGVRLLPGEIDLRIEAAIDTVFKQPERPTLEKLRRDIRKDCDAAGLKPPSRKAIRARVSARSLKELVKARDGTKAARQKFAPVGPGLRPCHMLAIVQIDHTRVDIQLVDDLARAVVGRPWLTLVLDVFSHSVLGFYLSFDAPSAAGVALAVGQAVLAKPEWLGECGLDLAWPMHGMPRSLHLDNGKEFHSKALRRGCQQHGIRIDYRPPPSRAQSPSTPRFGGHIERLMGTLMTRVHALPGTTSSNVAARGDYPAEQKAILTLREFERILALEILGPYHNEVHSALGTTPAAAWAAGVAAHAVRLPVDPVAFVLDFLPFEERVVRRDGVRLFNVSYFDGALAPLLDGTARKVRIKYDPRNMSAVFVELPAGGHLRLPCADLGRQAVTLWEQRAATQTLREAGRASVNEAAIFSAIEEQRRVLAEAQASSKAARRATPSLACSVARLPDRQSSATEPKPTAAPGMAPPGIVDEDDARVPCVVEEEAWKTEFLS